MEFSALLEWYEIADARAQAEQSSYEEFQDRLRSRYGIAEPMAPEDGEDE